MHMVKWDLNILIRLYMQVNLNILFFRNGQILQFIFFFEIYCTHFTQRNDRKNISLP